MHVVHSLNEVLATRELTTRARRQPEFALESETLARLSSRLTSHPAQIIQSLVDAVLECCHADSSGISILEANPATPEHPSGLIYWQATAGLLADEAGGTIPLESCPSSVVIDYDETVLFDHPARYFEELNRIEPAIREALVVPFHVNSSPVGAVWAFIQTQGDGFDAEDARLLTSLSRFAAAGYQLASSLHTSETNREELERCVRERTRELERTNHELRREIARREQVEAQQQMLASRLRDLANEVTSAEQRERKRLASVLHDNLQQLLAAATLQIGKARQGDNPDAVERIAELIGEADEVSRDLTEQLRPPTLYEAGLLPALRRLASRMAHFDQLKVTIEVGDDCNEDRLQMNDDSKAFLFGGIRELLFNTAKHAHTNEATVRIRHDPPDRLNVVVEDQGRGFEPDTAHGDANTDGFGLFSLDERVAALGGNMTIDSAPGRGTRVEINFPLGTVEEGGSAAQDATPHENPTRSLHKGPKPARVLIVDDHAIVRQSIASALAHDSRLTVVAEAQDGLEAIDAAERFAPDVVVMDVNMPRMNGVEATRRIHARWPEIAIIGLSVQEDESVAEAMRKAGALDLVPKSLGLAEMIASITGDERSGAA